jgi:hypothetical protein
MIRDLEKRTKFWGDNYTTDKMSDSLAFPCVEYLDDFRDKFVLEIGPGDGRQFKEVYPLASFYALADISNTVLVQEQYKSLLRFNIVDYDYVFPMSFDVVHFWYVLHHVRKDELSSFFGFVSRHVVEGGIVLFNTAPMDYPEGGYKSNGISTTKFTPQKIRKALKANGLIILSEKEVNHKSTGIVFRARRLE